tara:strand:- start:10768 stop:11178 length:411 start_codon:yes stop_codon:yes gene_type:complete
MIQLTRGQANDIYLNLADVRTNSTGYFYLFGLTNEMTQSTTYVIAVKVSTNDRYDKLRITENNTEDKPNGTVKLFPEGFFKYIVYEQTSSSNLDPTDSSVVGELDRGVAYVSSNPFMKESTFTEYTTTDTNTIYVK